MTTTLENILTSERQRLAEFHSPFADKPEIGPEFKPLSVEIFQMNLGKLCNQICTHCHVDAGPNRTEIMQESVVDSCLKIIKDTPQIKTIDLTGGAPEMNPHFKKIVTEVSKMGKHVIDRCNLTILEEAGYEFLYEFLTSHSVEIVASLPCYTEKVTNRQRGNGVFQKSIRALQNLNQHGYGKNLTLNLVYNPGGFFLAPDEKKLESEYRVRLLEDFGIEFSNLFCMQNVPINRYLKTLIAKGAFDKYMETLLQAYNPATVNQLMCRHQLSIGYDGKIYDCDFNQMLELECEDSIQLEGFNLAQVLNRKIQTGNHCFACTAGSGSSCTGSLSS